MRKVIMLIAALAAISLAGCGTQSPESEIRTVTKEFLSKAKDGNYAGACKVMDNTGECLKAFMMAKAFGIDAKELIPDGYESKTDKAKITITGNSATMAPVVADEKDPTEYVKRHGKWLMKWTEDN